MHETEDMERFIAEQRNKIARDRDTLQRNPTSAVTDYIMDEAEKRSHIKSRRPVVVEENMIPDPVQHEIAGKQVKTKPPTPQLFKLGEDYLKQKEKLKEELRLEYRKALAEKQVRTTGIRGQYSENYAQNAYSKKDPNDLGLSLPIRDHLSAKTNQAIPSKSATETYKDLLDRKRRQEKAYRDDDDDDGVDLDDRVIYREKPRRRNADIEDDARSLRRNKPTNKRRPRYQDRYHDSLDDSLDEDEEELLLRKIRARRQRKRLNQRFPDSDDEDNMLFERVQPKEPPESKRRLSSAQNRDVGRKPVYMSNEKENDPRSKSAPPEQEYTGLLIGKVTSANTVQRRKDEYKHDLQRQMEQKDINRKREKELELRIDASGANFRDIQELTPRKQNKKRG
uniref:Uncharacterized protein n=1 Tax=Ciona savignyi TaxID=51511 RepID=H2YJE5_CIOSA